MAGWTYTVNQAPATGADAWVILITALLAQGWTIPVWSDGAVIQYSGTPTAGNLQGSLAWFRMRSPADPNTGQHREFVIQNGGPGYNIASIKYSAVAGFNATTLPGVVASVTNGSTAITFTPQIDVPAMTFSLSSQPGTLYTVTAPVNGTSGTLTGAYTGPTDLTQVVTITPMTRTLLGTVNVQNGFATVTFSTTQSAIAGTAVVFGSQAALYYLAVDCIASTTATLTVPYSGTTNAATTTQMSDSTVHNCPAAADEVLWSNANNVNAGNLGFFSATINSQWFPLPTDGTYHMHLVAGDATKNYSWAFSCVTNGTQNVVASMGMDIYVPLSTLDLDPCAILAEIGSSACWDFTTTGHNNQNTNMGHCGGTPAPTVSTGGFGGTLGLTFGNQLLTTPAWRALPVNSWSGEIPISTPVYITVPVNILQAGAVRGYSTLFLADLANTARTSMDLFQIVSPGDYYWVNGTLIPWPTGVAVVT